MRMLKEWNNITRLQCRGGGVHLYIRGKDLKDLLKLASIDGDTRALEMRVVSCAGSLGSAAVLIEIRKRRGDGSNEDDVLQ